MGPMSDTPKKSKIVSTVQEKAAHTTVDHEVDIKKIRIGDYSIFQAVTYAVYDDFIAVIGKLDIQIHYAKYPLKSFILVSN